MASIEIPSGKKTAGQKKLIKKSTRIDLTPMVDLGFLLITFFVFTTNMAKPKVMNINLPFDKTIVTDDVCASCVLTVVPVGADQLKYYEGDIDTAAIKLTDYRSLRQLIQQKKVNVKKTVGNPDRFVLIVKPSSYSTFKNFVDISDEVIINAVKRYYIDELSSAEEKKLNL